MKITYFIEVISSWCYWGEPAWTELKQRYAGRVQFEWKIALMRPQDFPVSTAQCDWFYRRSGTIMQSPRMLSSAWRDPQAASHDAASLVAEAGKDFGITDDRIRVALAKAALEDGRKVGQMDEAAAVGAKAGGLPVRKLRARAESAAVRARAEASTAEFFSYRIDQRPAFVLEDEIGDKAVFSGLARPAAVIAAVDAMLADVAAYAAYAAHHGGVPPS